MSRLLLVMTIVSALFVSSCKKDKKPDEGTPAAQDTTVSSEPMNFDVMGSDSGKIEGLQTINFEYDKSRLTTEGKAIAKGNAEWMKKNSSASLTIEGHCDRHGSIEYNMALGERRAKTVKDYLVNLGVSASRLKTISYGKEKPLDPAETEAADGKNRRANFLVAK